MKTYIHLLEKIWQLEQKNFASTDEVISQVMKLKRQFVKENNIPDIPTNTELLQEYRKAIEDGSFQRSVFLEQVLKKRAVRSQSWIVPIQVLTKPFWCPGQCIFCPNDPTMPKSYIKTEPGAMRALMNQFDPHKQVYNRLLSLYRTGHDTDKIEMIVLGGTWDVYPKSYKESFLKWLYDACNTFEEFMQKIPDLAKDVLVKENDNVIDEVDVIEDSSSSNAVIGMPNFSIDDLNITFPTSIEESIRINETAQHRIIWLTVETRPEYITDENCRLWRTWGVTRLEMGLQSMFDDVLDMNKRGHTVQQARQAVHKMRQYGFKFSIHFMPWLYGSTIQKDIDSFILAYADPFFKPDEIKFYPTSVIPNTELFQLYTQWDYKPLQEQDLKRIIKIVQREIIPPYTRIKRLIRDIPSQEIVAWSDITNLRQITENEMLQEHLQNPALRGALYNRLYPDVSYYSTFDDVLETIKHSLDTNDLAENLQSGQGQDARILTYVIWSPIDFQTMRNYVSLDTRAREMRHRKNQNPMYIQMIIRRYTSSVGDEFFLSFEDDLWYIYAFTRLLLPKESEAMQREWLWKNTALIRELHVYGQLAKIHKWDGQIDGWESVQHTWFWTQLMESAESVSKKVGYQKISVISGVWVREYYKKLGYHLEGTYMVKKL